MLFPTHVLLTVYRPEPLRCGIIACRWLATATLFCGLAGALPDQVAAQSDRAADRLVAGWIKAAGGSDLWDRVRSLRYTSTTVWYDSTEKEVRRRPRYVWIDKSPGAYRVRVERQEAVGKYVQVWDGQRPWATLNGGALPDSAQAVREVPYVTSELVYWMGLPWKLHDPGVNRSYVAPGTVHVTFGSGVGLHDGDRYWYRWRDSQSPFPTDVEYIEQGKTENDRNRLVWSDWTRFGPAVYAGRRRLVNQSGRTLRALLISAVTVNESMPDSLFIKR